MSDPETLWPRRSAEPNELNKIKILLLVAMGDLEFVEWDRWAPSRTSAVAYGWIRRDDGRSDFVLLTATATGLGHTTSSAEWSREISRRLYGNADNHCDCLRIEHDFPGLGNVIRLPAIDCGAVRLGCGAVEGASTGAEMVEPEPAQ